MNINDFVYEYIKKEFQPKYVHNVYQEVIDHMAGNKKGNKFISSYSKIIMDKYNQNKGE